MFNKLSVAWRFAIIDLVLFTLLYIAGNQHSFKSALVLFFGAFMIRLFFILFFLEITSFFVVWLKRWLPVFVSYCILFFLGYLVLIAFAKSAMSPIGWEHVLIATHFTIENSCYVYPFIAAAVYFLYDLKK